MTVTLKPLLCPTPRCGKLLAHAVSVTVGEIEIKCRRCGQEVRIRVAPDADHLLEYAIQLKTQESPDVESSLT